MSAPCRALPDRLGLSTDHGSGREAQRLRPRVRSERAGATAASVVVRAVRAAGVGKKGSMW